MTDVMTVRDQMLSFACGYCGVAVGEWCRTKSGNRASFLHADRWWAWKDSQTEKHNQEGTT